ncbi:winged helix-turn-helix domain-containing protein [Nocardioides sp. NPDC051685]|uniref:winged helix-turn-helix domain-containing protein n=1 Tax=Nocardioides sp. NPDC051685 TaxID=3364334 RepID=UPI0037898E22
MVNRIAGVLGDDVLLTDVADSDRAVATLTAMKLQGTSAVPAPTRFEAATLTVQLDRPGRRALHGGRDLRLSPREFDLLTMLLDQPGRAWSYDDLCSKVWCQPYLGDPDTIATAIRRLRKRLGPVSSVEITALRGFGYRLDILNESDDIAS